MHDDSFLDSLKDASTRYDEAIKTSDRLDRHLTRALDYLAKARKAVEDLQEDMRRGKI